MPLNHGIKNAKELLDHLKRENMKRDTSLKRRKMYQLRKERRAAEKASLDEINKIKQRRS